MGGNYTQDPFETFWDQRGPITALAGYDATTSWSVDIKAQANKSILVKNTGSAQLTYQVLASLDGGAEFDWTLKSDTTVAATNGISLFQFADHFTNIKIQVKGVGAIATIKCSASGN